MAPVDSGAPHHTPHAPQRQVIMNKMNLFFVSIFFASISTMLSLENKDSELFWAVGFTMFFSSLYIILKVKSSILTNLSSECVEEKNENEGRNFGKL